jgi:hypothetical protein
MAHTPILMERGLDETTTPLSVYGFKGGQVLGKLIWTLIFRRGNPWVARYFGRSKPRPYSTQ